MIYDANNNPIPLRRQIKKRKMYHILILLVIIVGLIGYGTYVINEFFDGHKLQFQNPVRVQSPLRVISRTSLLTLPNGYPIISEAHAATVAANNGGEETVGILTDKTPGLSNTEKIVSRIYILESSGGVHDSCKATGRYNGYGFAPGTCYATHEEVENLVEKWITTHSGTLAQKLCLYNTGKKLNDCSYLGDWTVLKKYWICREVYLLMKP